MDDLRFGGAIRASRVRKGWRQIDLASAAGVSTGTISRLERGQLDRMPMEILRRVAAALDIRIELLPRSRGADLDRLVNAKHAALAEAVVARLKLVGGWEVRPEVSFSIWGERGVVDVLAWHAGRTAMLVIELKTEVVDVGELLGTLDRKRRLGRKIAEDAGWRPATVSAWLAIGDGMTNRRRVTAHSATLRAALPADGRELRRWLRDPAGEVRALTFVSDGPPGNVRSTFTTIRRVSAKRLAGRPAVSSRWERGSG
jgi:transcriptional regulator with XRE-family HTH domain